ncbi:S41 family peptidase [Flavobacterium lindanitolerans]|uniref:C-terminal processing protease CtpA/Prc n=1 Tax=Flavobacterium lindanitolerans TaxID=428988 RepID=A0A497UFC6_9FLAO|nr:S41 family peptidase [Flavobacterium lindanitolerans]PKW20131.1 C-terminal processing protease CtpA/Prc [Flavobacterium lindanitolerans]RLJ23373.1 C-terminal processing protease CtpA/Prc [Flavobacterium lindanitolerans]
MKKTFIFAILLFIGISSFFACQDDLDDIEVPKELKINDFIWKGLNLYYYWQADVTDLSDSRFANQGELNAYLNGFSSPEDLFYSLLNNYPNTDRFSVIFSDYTVLEGVLSGNTANNGVDYQLLRKAEGSDEVFGWVRYIIPNSDASSKDIRRGDIFYAVNGTPLNVNNYRELLAGQNYTLNLADYDSGNITPNSRSVALTKTDLAENPILINKVLTYDTHKIGYLMYNGFYGEYDNNLNAVFGQFRAEGVTDLVLDLRYNSGGAVKSATYLASMITGQFNGQVFAKQQWNAKIEDYFNDNDPEQLINRFSNSIGGNAINSLNLTKVYILTSKSTASSSELVINGLKPYIEVVQIGDVTVGKNVGSVTLYDSPSFGKQGRSNRHKYAMQPICFKIVNSAGFGEYQNGISPPTPQPENLGDLGVLGEPTEPLLSMAISQITNAGRRRMQQPDKTFEPFKDRKSMQRFGTEMYIDKVPDGIKDFFKF